MKKIIYTLAVLAVATLVTACGGNSGGSNNGGTKFNPEERKSSLTESERAAALAAKRAEQDVDFGTLLSERSLRLAIAQPAIEGDITSDVADRVSMRLLQITSQNGISGIGDGTFVCGVKIVETGRVATSTAPQKMTLKYELQFSVVNNVTGDVYATATQEVVGVGNTFREAALNAVGEIKNTAALQSMLATASERIIGWYNDNLHVIKNYVEGAESAGDYALALAILNSIPEQATETYKYVAEKQTPLTEKMLHQKATTTLASMEALIAKLGDEFNPAVGAYFELIPIDSPYYENAKTAFAEYSSKCAARREALEAEAAHEAEAARAAEAAKAAAELEELKMLYAHEEQLAALETEKIKAQYEYDASVAASSAAPKSVAASSAAPKHELTAPKQERGLLQTISYAIGGTFERLFTVADTVGGIIKEGLDKRREEQK